MKTKTTLLIITVITLLFFPNINYAQAPYLGTAADFVLFTTTGAVGNAGISQITGNVGTNNGAITGCNLVIGEVHNADAVTLQCASDVSAAYSQLFNAAPTSSSHAPEFGSGETLFPGVYAVAAAGSVTGTLTLDAQGNPDAVFIFKFAGAFTTGAPAQVNLINGAMACNVFWAAEGAMSLATGTDMKGTLIANNGAVSLADGGTLEGRLLSTAGAANVDGVIAAVPVGCPVVILPMEFVSFTGHCDKQNIILNWTTATETDNTNFTIEQSNGSLNWEAIGTIPGAGNSAGMHSYTFTDRSPHSGGISFYRIKKTNFNGSIKYGNIIAVKTCGPASAGAATSEATIYPNPSSGKFALLYTGTSSDIHAINIFNTQGQQVHASTGFQSKFDLSANAPGIYFMHIVLDGRTITLKIVVE